MKLYELKRNVGCGSIDRYSYKPFIVGGVELGMIIQSKIKEFFFIYNTMVTIDELLCELCYTDGLELKEMFREVGTVRR